MPSFHRLKAGILPISVGQVERHILRCLLHL